MKTFLIRGCVLLCICLLIVTWFFAHELGQKFKSTTSALFTSDLAPATWLEEGQTGKIVGFQLVDARKDAAAIAIEGLAAGEIKDGKVEIKFQLVNKGSSDFPWLRLYLMDDQGRTVRSVDVSPTDYRHGSVFTTEQTSIVVSLRAGEKRFTVAPFFPNNEGPR